MVPRILAMPSAISEFREGVDALPYIPDVYRENRQLVSALPHTCKMGMEKLERTHRWAGIQDSRTYLRGFLEGAECVLRILDSTRLNKE